MLPETKHNAHGDAEQGKAMQTNGTLDAHFVQKNGDAASVL
jgi:hypothetical protein